MDINREIAELIEAVREEVKYQEDNYDEPNIRLIRALQAFEDKDNV
jgi:hypothetical protein